MNSLIQKYNIPGPRYTSYPTVPFWKTEEFSEEQWKLRVKKTFQATNSTEGISLYIHLPFCESLCTFCGCHKRITKRHELENPYIETLLKEWQLYLNLFDEKPVLKELHLGGGTPTFFSPESLKELLETIFSTSIVPVDAIYSFEGHPNNTLFEHLKTLRDLGFTRVSFGVQDYDPKVQKAIHRIQSFEKVQEVTEWARALGYTSVSHDIIYGLPFQTVESIEQTIANTKKLQPDRISFYSYAHVPWIKGNGQRGFKDEDLPKDEEKRNLYELGKQRLQEAGYYEIGMDHFALESDSLYQSFKNATMHRNFMGYSSSKTSLMIGLGMSSIGDTQDSFYQNEKELEKYTALVAEGKFPLLKGHLHSDEDLILRQTILDIICHFQTDLSKVYLIISQEEIEKKLEELIKDQLLTIENHQLTVTELGKTFVRNICMAFDDYLIKNQPKTQLFSMTI
ncbi:oxygen-independent coproporphyrinogen III oxidase [Capnocytophaga sp. ARDL2]|uniref:oxygen-independent coproporphyrinogen III oxidase n=1 Tax=Capnocytophaga sp. ARDL2 TaxID=3238809 RepID=UPI0035592C9D